MKGTCVCLLIFTTACQTTKQENPLETLARRTTITAHNVEALTAEQRQWNDHFMQLHGGQERIIETVETAGAEVVTAVANAQTELAQDHADQDRKLATIDRTTQAIHKDVASLRQQVASLETSVQQLANGTGSTTPAAGQIKPVTTDVIELSLLKSRHQWVELTANPCQRTDLRVTLVRKKGGIPKNPRDGVVLFKDHLLDKYTIFFDDKPSRSSQDKYVAFLKAPNGQEWTVAAKDTFLAYTN